MRRRWKGEVLGVRRRRWFSAAAVVAAPLTEQGLRDAFDRVAGRSLSRPCQVDCSVVVAGSGHLVEFFGVDVAPWSVLVRALGGPRSARVEWLEGPLVQTPAGSVFGRSLEEMRRVRLLGPVGVLIVSGLVG